MVDLMWLKEGNHAASGKSFYLFISIYEWGKFCTDVVKTQ